MFRMDIPFVISCDAVIWFFNVVWSVVLSIDIEIGGHSYIGFV